MALVLRFEAHPQPNPCEARVELVDGSVGRCGQPALTVAYVDPGSFLEGDPRRDHTVFPVCPEHESRGVVEQIVGTEGLA